MPKYRENRIRGTVDFPLSRYYVKKYNNYNNISEPHWHPEIEFFHVLEGEIAVSVSSEKYVLKTGDILFVSPGELHSVAPHKLPITYNVAVLSTSLFEFREPNFFEECFTNPLIKQALLFPRLITNKHMYYSEIEHFISKIFDKETESKALIYSNLIALFSFLIHNSLMVPRKVGTTDKHAEDIKLCLNYIDDNYAKKIKLSDLANLVHTSPNYFCKYFKEYTGVTPFTHIIYVRIKKACSFLLKTNDSILTVAGNCGFENISLFIREFKKNMECTPSAYRKSHNIKHK